MRATRIQTLAVVVLTLGLTGAASAAEVKQEITVPQGSWTLWRKIGPFCAIKAWHPAIANCERSREKLTFFRTLTLKDGGKIKEKLTGAGKGSYSYSIEESALPVKNYTATIAVAPAAADKKQSTITWTAKFDPKDKTEAEAKAVIDGIFKAGLDGIKAQAVAENEKAAKAATERKAKIDAAKITVLEKAAKLKAEVAEKAKQAAEAAKAAYEKAKTAVQAATPAPAAKPAEAKK